MIKVLVWVAAVYLLYCGALFLLQRQMIFPRYLMGAPASQPTEIRGVETFWVETAQGRVEAWYLPPDRATAPAPAIIFAHGNAERIDYLPPEFRPLTRMGIGVLLVEYPGYGRSPGTPSQASITSAMVAAYDRLAARPDVDPSRIVLYGRSLGGGAVCALAARRPSAAMILVSSFTSVRAFARRYGIPAFLVRDPFDNLAVVRTYPHPLLIIHGRHDEVIPYRHGEALYQAAPSAKFLSYDCGHNDCPPDQGRFLRDLSEFLTQSGVLRQPPNG